MPTTDNGPVDLNQDQALTSSAEERAKKREEDAKARRESFEASQKARAEAFEREQNAREAKMEREENETEAHIQRDAKIAACRPSDQLSKCRAWAARLL